MEAGGKAAKVSGSQSQEMVQKLLSLLIRPHKCILTVTTTANKQMCMQIIINTYMYIESN